MIGSSYWIYNWIIPFIVLFFFVFSTLSFLVGAGLIVNSSRMFKFFEVMNRWTSLRQKTRWAAIPRDIHPVVHQYRLWIGTVFIVVGLVGLVSGHDLALVIAGLKVDVSRIVMSIAFQTLAWFVVVGNAFAIILGIILIASPATYNAIRLRLDRWVSTRKMGVGGDTMRLSLDKWIESSPKAAGWVISVVSLFVAADFGAILFSLR
jgi:hypothetical protein